MGNTANQKDEPGSFSHRLYENLDNRFKLDQEALNIEKTNGLAHIS